MATIDDETLAKIINLENQVKFLQSELGRIAEPMHCKACGKLFYRAKMVYNNRNMQIYCTKNCSRYFQRKAQHNRLSFKPLFKGEEDYGK